MAFPEPIEPSYWQDVHLPEGQDIQKPDTMIDMDAEELEEDIETELEADFDDANILDALASLGRELDEALLEIDDDAGKDKPAAIIP
ncbi:MAG: hypothetical protein JXB38_03500 [Anaerolineales bacterium]|nr:hypothetical protein [Anaerolineales bacterium]